MLDKHLRDEFNAIQDVNERLKWIMDKLESGAINSCTALQLAWDDGARTTIGDPVIVVDICEGEAESVQEMSRLGASAYIDGFGSGASYYGAGCAGAYVWPEDVEHLDEEEREAVEIAVAEYMARKAAPEQDPS